MDYKNEIIQMINRIFNNDAGTCGGRRRAVTGWQ